MSDLHLMTREEAEIELLAPYGAMILGAYDDAFERMRTFSADYPETSDITIAGMRRDQVVRFARQRLADVVASGAAVWVPRLHLPTLEFIKEKAILRFNRLDSSLAIARNKTAHSKQAHEQRFSQHALPFEEDAAHRQRRTTIIVAGAQWDSDMVEPPRVFLVARERGRMLWPLLIERALPAIHSATALSVDASTESAPKRTAVRSKKAKVESEAQ